MDSDSSGYAKKRASHSLVAVIDRGKQLQKKKPCNLNKSSLHVLNEEVPCEKNSHYRSRQKNANPSMRRTAPARSTYTSRSSPTRLRRHRSPSPSFVINSGSQRGCINANKRKRLKCPLRIAELAVPSKRHCIETWRDRSDVLPTFMLERLKHLVMNQKVLATVPEAIQCFKYQQGREPSPSRRRLEIRSPSPRKAKRQSQEFADIKIMCAVFAHRIAKRLIKNIQNFEQCLTEDLEKLSNIVADEIRKLIQNRRICADYVYNLELLKEMSGKVTMWIVDILSEAQYNMQEDELKVEKNQENIMGKEGNLETLINQYHDWQFGKRHSNLEEEEGPALDALDALVANVLDICLIKKESGSVDYESHEDEVSTDEATPNKASPDESIAGEATNKSDQEHSSIIKNEVLDEDTNNNSALETTELDVINNIPDENGVHNMTDMIRQDNEDSDSQYDSTADVESTDNKKIVETADGDINVSDVSVTLEESLDDRKKVKFSQVKDDGPGEIGGIEADGAPMTVIDESEPIISNKSLQNWPNYSHSATFIRSDIVFQPPNQSILSIADESWPDDFMAPVLKPSASVSKSITSLGEIKEVDETEQHDRKAVKVNQNSKTNSKANTTSSTSHNRGQSENSAERWSSPAATSFERVPPSKLLNDLKALIAAEENEQLNEREIKKENYDVESLKGDNSFNDTESFQNNSAGKGDHIQGQSSTLDDTDTDPNPIVQAIKEKLKQESQAKFDYRVHPQTAPSWAITSASDDSEPISGRARRLDPGELRKWCKDIEHTLINLEEWNNWIHVTCKQILYMKHQTVTSRRLTPQQRTCILAGWTKLKKGIDKDAIVWRKLNARTLQVLKTYSPKPKSRKSSPLPIQNKKRIKKESISEVILTIEGMSTWLHRSIVSTEHIVKCNCYNSMSRPQTSKVLKKQRKNI